jgi:DNA-binding transcriptional ArsR family regulator
MGYRLDMRRTRDVLFKALADPTRRAVFERLCRHGEQTVRALTDIRASRSRPSRSIWAC